MRFLSRCGVIVVAASLLHAPVQGGQGAHGKAAGVVSEANQAYLGTTNAVTGADVYDCENLETRTKARFAFRSARVRSIFRRRARHSSNKTSTRLKCS